jgi:hypothetical protein
LHKNAPKRHKTAGRRRPFVDKTRALVDKFIRNSAFPERPFAFYLPILYFCNNKKTMKKSLFAALAFASSLLLTTSCDTLNGGQPSAANALSALNTGGTMLTNLVGNFLNGGSVTERDLVGTWTYNGVNCVFESQNLLAQAGGVAASSALETKIDEQLKRYGISKGVTRFTFNADKTFTATLNGRNMSGTYSLDTASKTLHLQFVGGLLNLQPQVTRNGNGIALLFESDKLLGLLSTASSFLGKMGNSNLAMVSSLLGNYQGMRIGLKLSK